MNGRWIGASITHAFCFYHKYFVLLAIPSDNYWKFLLKALDFLVFLC